MKKKYLLFFLLCSLAIVLCVKIVGHSQKAEKLNDEQVQNLLISAEQLNFPEGIEWGVTGPEIGGVTETSYFSVGVTPQNALAILAAAFGGAGVVAANG